MHRPDEQIAGAFFAVEQAIAEFYSQEPDLVDAEVADVLYALGRLYSARARKEGCGRPRLDARTSRLYQRLAGVSEALMDARAVEENAPGAEPYSVEDVVRCLKRTRESVAIWSRQRGRQGYLNYVTEFIAGIGQ